MKSYSAHFKNGTFIEKFTFEDAKAVPYSEYILSTEVLNPKADRYWVRKHRILDNEGNPKTLRIGNFELIDISDDVAGWNTLYQNLTFFDHNTSNAFIIQSNGNFLPNFHESLILFLNRLNELGRYEAFQNLEKIQKQEKDIAILNDRLSKKDERIKELEEEIKKLKEQ